MDLLNGPIAKFNNMDTKNIEMGRNEAITLDERDIDYVDGQAMEEKKKSVKDLTEDMLEDIINRTNERPTMGEVPEQTSGVYTIEDDER